MNPGPENEKKVLIVETDPRMMMNLEMIVREEDLKAITSKDGLEAYEIAKKEIPDLVISAINLPNLDGITFCKLLKLDAQFENIKFIFLTHLLDKEYLDNARKAGASDVITKPISTEDILPAIQNAVGRCRWKGQKILWLEK